ncbi:MAG: hypothetical protein PF442_03260 [Desulfobulbaceae bacterium]|jgi:hypothetical protein|nr:hypothetical protein [Desulfobulbaceae bacterium]
MTMTDVKIDREFIPSLREGVDVIRMVFFKKMREFLVAKYPDQEKMFYGMIAAAVMNELFGTPNPDEKMQQFVQDNSGLITTELQQIGVNFGDFRIPLTDALRIHYLCNFQEEIDDAAATVLAQAKALGVLIEERDVPLPKGFMELVYRIGKAHGLLQDETAH